MDKLPDRPSDIVSYVPWRHPSYKFHNKLQNAKAAVALKGFGTIYAWNWQTDEWEILFDVPRPDGPIYYGTRQKMPWQKD